MEPEEGRYELDWLERAIAQAAAHHIVTVLGTPTDTPPAWLTQKYPDTLRVDANGRRAEHGGRRQFSYVSPRYREFSRRIVEKLAARFGRNPNVVGWQIGNEYTEDPFDDHARLGFQQWLAAKYKTLDALNEHWATAYWSETYTRWDQIPLAAPRGNPGLLLDYRRFVTDVWRDFQRNQLDVIRAHADAAQFVTTNYGGLGWANRFDRHTVAADLDLISWDEYVGQGHPDADYNGAIHDLARGWKRQNFWVMEAQPGFVDWAPVSNSLDRGETRAMAWQAVGHGADCYTFWQWRSALNGQEQYHGTLAGPDGEPVPIYEEIRQLGREFAATSAALAGTAPVSEAAILHDYDSRWAIDFHPQTQRYDQLQVLLGYYHPLRPGRRPSRAGPAIGHERMPTIPSTHSGSRARCRRRWADGWNSITPCSTTCRCRAPGAPARRRFGRRCCRPTPRTRRCCCVTVRRTVRSTTSPPSSRVRWAKAASRTLGHCSTPRSCRQPSNGWRRVRVCGRSSDRSRMTSKSAAAARSLFCSTTPDSRAQWLCPTLRATSWRALNCGTQ